MDNRPISHLDLGSTPRPAQDRACCTLDRVDFHEVKCPKKMIDFPFAGKELMLDKEQGGPRELSRRLCSELVPKNLETTSSINEVPTRRHRLF